MIIFDLLIILITDVVINFLLAWPGATIVWLFSNKKKSIKEIHQKGDIFVNAAIGLMFIVFLLPFIFWLVSVSN